MIIYDHGEAFSVAIDAIFIRACLLPRSEKIHRELSTGNRLIHPHPMETRNMVIYDHLGKYDLYPITVDALHYLLFNNIIVKIQIVVKYSSF